MKTTALFISALLISSGLLLGQFTPPKGAVVPRFNPNGIWESPSGVKYNLRVNGDNLIVKLEGTNATFLQYELTLKHLRPEDTLGDDNRYEGTGFFRAKLKSGKECRFDTKWEIVVIDPKSILGNAPNYLDPDPETCKPKETVGVRIELSKK
jgi:hypothetical protein